MGSGHFLVTAVDFLSDYIADVVEYVPGVPDWLGNDDGGAYVSPLVDRIARIRREILDRARESQWTLDASQLTDQAIIRRMVLKRCIYGVDKNPLAVELAKVALWLHSFTVGAPLSFLDHHLRCGDSLLGLRVTEGVAELNRVAGLGAQSAIAGAEAAAEGMARIEMLSDADVTEVRESAALFAGVEVTTADLRSLLDVLCGLRWLTAGMKKRERTLCEAPLFELLRQRPQDAFKLLAHGPDIDEAHGPDLRHSRERGNPSSPRPLDSGFHRSDDQDPAASSGSAGLQPASASETPNPIRHSGESRNPEAPNREDDNARHTRAHNVRHTGEGHNIRHSRESGNPSSPPPMDSRFHGSNDQDPAASSGSAGLEPASASEIPSPIRHSGESRNPEAANREDDNARHTRDHNVRLSSESHNVRHSGEGHNVRHSRESGNPSSPRSLDSGLRRSDESRSVASEFTTLWRRARAIADRETFLHWEAAFPGVWEQWQDAHPQGGFDAVIGNPPWDRIKLQEVEWFATRAPDLARAPTAAARRNAIKELRAQGDPLVGDFDAAKARADGLGKLVRASGHYPLLGGGDINLYSLFVERAMRLVKAGGLVGLLTPSGIYADKTAARFFKSVSTKGRVAGLFDFENRRLGTDLPPFFPDVDSRFKFCALIVGGSERQFAQTDCAFFLHSAKAIADVERCFPLTPDDFARVNPNTGTAPVFRTRRDADITRAIYAQHPVLVDRSDGDEKKIWPVKYHTMFHMASRSHYFRDSTQLEQEGFYPIQGNRWKRGEDLYLPLYQGRTIHQFDHRANSVQFSPENIHNQYLSEAVTEQQHSDPSYLPQFQNWVPASEVERAIHSNRGYALGFRDISRPTDVRTMIASVIPQVGCGDTLPVLLPSDNQLDTDSTACLLANLNSFALDYVTRQKVQGTHLKWYTVEQLPMIAPAAYDRKFGKTTARELVRDHVLKLTYTAHDMAPFARDLGYTGPPFIWDEEERRHLRARLDACYFHLYGIDRDDAAYILSTFPIFQRQDQAAYGTYRTHDLIRAYMNALTAGDTETIVDL